jgi:tetratricopeptide (TPR) repeat protein
VGSFGNLAVALRDAGELEKAEPLFLTAIELAEAIWPLDFPEIAHIRSEYGVWQVRNQLYDEAEATLLAAHEDLSGHADRPPTIRTLRGLVELYEAWGRTEEAARWQRVVDDKGRS